MNQYAHRQIVEGVLLREYMDKVIDRSIELLEKLKIKGKLIIYNWFNWKKIIIRDNNSPFYESREIKDKEIMPKGKIGEEGFRYLKDNKYTFKWKKGRVDWSKIREENPESDSYNGSNSFPARLDFNFDRKYCFFV
jgi:hypothetical protein